MHQEQLSKFEPRDEGDKVLWKTDSGTGEFVFTIDGKNEYNLFQDYPEKLTEEERLIFAKENPFWVQFFSDRLKELYGK